MYNNSKKGNKKMSCEFLDKDRDLIVRCTFTKNHVCKKWFETVNLLEDKNVHAFCEKQTKNFTPEEIDGDE